MKKKLNEFMVLKQQSNSLQEGPRCNPFAANGRGWSKGGCTHDSEENHRHCCPAVPAPCLPWADFRHKDHLPIPGPPRSHTAAVTLPGQGRSLAHHSRDEAPLAPHQTKDQGSCRSFLLPPGAGPGACAVSWFRAGPRGPQHPGTTGPFTPDGGWGWFWDASLIVERTERSGGTQSN